MNEYIAGRRADDFFRNAEYTSIAEDVRRETVKKNSGAVPFCETPVGKEGAALSSLANESV